MITEVPSPRGYSGATLTLDIDDTEHQRRQAAGLGVATRHGFGGLDVLISLPEGMPVPLSALTDDQRKYVVRAPAGVCTIADGRVTRHVTRPCRVAMATVRSPTASKTAMESAGRFAPFCPRQVIVQHEPRMVETLLEFGFYGIGVLLKHPGGELETLVEPCPWRPARHTPAGWRFAETAYAQFLHQLPDEEQAAPIPARKEQP